MDTLIHYPVPPHLSDAYQELNILQASLPIAEHIASTELSLPIGPHMDIEDANQVADTITEFIHENPTNSHLTKGV